MPVRVYTYDLTIDDDVTEEEGQDIIDNALSAAGIFTDSELISVVTEGEDEDDDDN